MPRFNITLIYQVEAESKYLARLKVGEALRLGVANGVTLDFESVQYDPTSDLGGGGSGPAAGETEEETPATSLEEVVVE
jgi:hypothetical protein